MNDYNQEIERIIKLVDEYTSKLKELISAYKVERRNRINFIALSTIGVLFLYAILLFYYQFNEFLLTNVSSLIILIVALLGFVALLIYMLVNFNKGKHNYRDISDEAYLISKQLSQLIKIASQSREHLGGMEGLAALEIDLKLTEAEDAQRRASKIFKF